MEQENLTGYTASARQCLYRNPAAQRHAPRPGGSTYDRIALVCHYCFFPCGTRRDVEEGRPAKSHILMSKRAIGRPPVRLHFWRFKRR